VLNKNPQRGFSIDQVCGESRCARILQRNLDIGGAMADANIYVLYPGTTYAIYPERQSDPAIYRKRGKFSKILSRLYYVEFNSA
jgi:hypothetical protein